MRLITRFYSTLIHRPEEAVDIQSELMLANGMVHLLQEWRRTKEVDKIGWTYMSFWRLWFTRKASPSTRAPSSESWLDKRLQNVREQRWEVVQQISSLCVRYIFTDLPSYPLFLGDTRILQGSPTHPTRIASHPHLARLYECWANCWSFLLIQSATGSEETWPYVTCTFT